MRPQSHALVSLYFALFLNKHCLHVCEAASEPKYTKNTLSDYKSLPGNVAQVPCEGSECPSAHDTGLDVLQWQALTGKSSSPLIEGSTRDNGEALVEGPKPKEPICPQDLCWDGSSRDPADCSCPEVPERVCDQCPPDMVEDPDGGRCACKPKPKEPICPEDLCWDGSNRDPADCSCPKEPPICPQDLCWDGSSRDPANCSCPPKIVCDVKCPPNMVADPVSCACKPKACLDLSGKYTATGHDDVELQQRGCTGRAVGHWTFTVVGNKVTIDGVGVTGIIKKNGEKVKIQWSNGIVYEKIITVCIDLSGKYTATAHGDVELKQQGCSGRAVGHWTFTVTGNKVTIDGVGVTGIIKKKDEKVKIQWSNGIVYEKIIKVVGGWSDAEKVDYEDLKVWNQVVDQTPRHGDLELNALGAPETVSKQVVAGTKYKFKFSDGSIVEVFSQPWTNTLEVTNVESRSGGP